MRNLSILIIFFFFSTTLNAQEILSTFGITSDTLIYATLKGKVLDKARDTVIDSSIVILLAEGKVVAQAITNVDGEYTLTRILPGRYTIRAERQGFRTQEITGVWCSADKRTYVDIPLSPDPKKGGVRLKPVED